MNYTHTETDLVIENHYPKLVRDRIPEIVKKDGKKANIKVLTDDEEYLDYLFAKLIEEASELARAESTSNQIEELADVNEVFTSILEIKGLSEHDLAEVQKQKRDERGGFKKRLLMLSKP